jgi:DNA polymerase I
MRVPPADIELTLVSGETELEAFRAWRPAGVVSCDIETTGLQPHGAHADKVRLVQFGDENHGWALPFEGNERYVQEALTKWAGGVVNHNSRFDESFLQAAGIDTGPQWEDTYIAHHLLYPTDWHGLKSVAGQLYGREVRAGERWLDQVKARNGWDWASVPIDHPAYWGYGALDAVLSARIWTDLAPRVEKVRPQYDRELLIARMMADVSARGLAVDLPYAEGLLARWAEEELQIRNYLEAHAIENPNSGKQVAAALMNDGWEPDLLTETGQVCVNKDVLTGLDNEIAAKVLRYRRLNKWAKSYVQPMIESGGRMHANISSLRAATGRMAISEPPLQQLPKGPEVRNAVVADEGTEMWAIDFTGQEARLLAAYVGDPEFTREVLEGGDIHGNIARSLFGPDYTKEQRGWSKNGFYAYCYGAEDKRLALTTHTRKGRFKKAVKDAYPAIAGFMEQVIDKGKERHERDGLAWAKTVGGRTVGVPKTRLYALTNYIMQGGGADLMKLGLESIAEAGLARTVRLVIHDEVLCCFPKGQGAEMAATVKAALETEFRGVPFEAHATGPGERWGDVV